MSRWAITAALAVGVVLGLGGSFVPEGTLQAKLWLVSAVGVIVASVLLASWMMRERRDRTAAGFALLALGETVVVTMASSAEPLVVFAHGVAVYVPALLLLAFTQRFPVWVRFSSAGAAVAFAAHVALYLGGVLLGPADPVAGVGYGLLSLTMVGWGVVLWKDGPSGASVDGVEASVP